MSIRASLLAICLSAAWAAGCGGSSSAEPDAQFNADLGVGQSCFAIAECAFQCTAGDGTCVETCVGKGTPAAQQAYAALTTCAYELCLGASDGGAPVADGGGLGACTSETDQSAGCIQCVQNQMQTPTCASFATSCANQ